MKAERDMIVKGWDMCCSSMFDVNNKEKRQEAVIENSKKEFEVEGFVPEGEEEEKEVELDRGSDDEEKDALDIMKEIKQGERKGGRKRKQAKSFGFQINSQQIAMSEDSS